MTRQQIVDSIAASGLDNRRIFQWMARVEMGPLYDEPHWDVWDAFYGHLVVLYGAPLEERRQQLRACCRAFDLRIPVAIEDDAGEQMELF